MDTSHSIIRVRRECEKRGKLRSVLKRRLENQTETGECSRRQKERSLSDVSDEIPVKTAVVDLHDGQLSSP